MAGAVRGAPALRIHLAGGFAVFVGDDPRPTPLPAGKAVSLLALLLVRRGRPVGIDTIVDALWGAEPPAKAEQNVASLVSRLRRVVGRDRIAGSGHGYRWPGDPDCRVDLDEAERILATAERELAAGEGSLATVAAGRALDLLGRGEILADQPPADWVDDARRDGERLLRRARRCGWEAALALDEHRRAAALAAAALAADPLDEEACRALMLAQQRAGAPGAALATFERLRERLADELGSDPGPETATLHLAILRGEPLVAPPETTRRLAQPDRGALVGRKAEFQALESAWTSAASGHAELVLVTGVAGTGKSRLVAELGHLVESTGGTVASARCYQAERSLFLQPLLEAVRTWTAGLPPATVRDLAEGWSGTLIQLLPSLGRLLGPVDYQRAAPELEHHRSLEAIASLLGRLAARQPLLLVLEDLQHAGTATLEAVHFLTRRLQTARLLLAATVRSETGAEALSALGGLGRGIDVGPLSRAGVAELAARMGVEDQADAVYETTGGHAAFVVETLRLLADDGGTRGVAPTSLQAVVLERVRQAGPRVEELLRVAAIVGTAFDPDLVARLGGLEPEQATRLAEQALRAGLLVTSGSSFAFASTLVRDVLYDTTPLPVRASRHRRATVLLAGVPETAATHHAAAGDWAAAAAAWSAAAEQAVLAFALRDAERLVGEALRAAETSGRRDLVARARLRRGEIREDLADYADARNDHSAALELARALGDAGLEARALERLGWTASYARDTDTASDLAARAGELAEEAAAAPAAQPSALVLAGRLRHWDGDLAGASAAYHEALAADPDPATAAKALGFLGALLEHSDRFDDARRVLGQAIVQCERTGALRSLLLSMFFSGLARANLGDLGGALRILERMQRLRDEYDLTYYRAGVETTLAWVWRELGELGRARDLAEQALEEARSDSGMLELEQALHALLAVADSCLLNGDETQAAALAEVAAPLLNRRLPFHARAELRHAEVRARLEPGPDRAELLLDLARRRESPKYQALALARLGQVEEAVRTALPTRSDLLLAEVAPPAQARATLDRITRALPPELRAGFAASGRLARQLVTRS